MRFVSIRLFTETSFTIRVLKNRILFSSSAQLSSDPFMSQVSHAANLVAQLSSTIDATQEELTELLAAQLSHSDGIRGFFVTYLTGEGDTVADLEIVPNALVKAMAQANPEELIPLACTYLQHLCLSGCYTILLMESNTGFVST